MKSIFLALAFANQATAAIFPYINITLTPNLTPGNGTKSLSGQLTTDISFKANETVAALPLTIAGQPSAQYDSESLTVTDGAGTLPLIITEGTGSSGLTSRFWIATRDVVPPVAISFTAHPREVNETTKMSPLFDIRENEGGILGSIWALVPVPDDTSTEFQITLSWDLSTSPSGTRGVWTWGEGPQPVTINGTTDDLLNDGTKPYKVFIRYNENVGTGGTALYNSFTFGWHDRNKTTTNDTKLLLAHEITHNWPYIYNGNLSDQTRYAEGTAEFYSLRNLWRAGLLITLKYVTAMNTKAIAYYQNPSINLTDQEAVDQSWTVSTAQTVPYGRGLMYLANVDAEVRARWNNTRSLDDVVVDLMNLCRSDDTKDAYFHLLTKYAGSSAVDEDKFVASGDPVIRPTEGSLGPCFEVVQSYTNATVWTWQLRDGFDIDDDKCRW
ncbi:hypothetical protein COL940_006551 [Colletotrichum noveboracense]|nr:hypothetical protein CBS470a_009292 [Colletotrichum nupharicola]KAJ0279809.1 hypothetical protein COL940_006551 [Colletotrichum noveboracense]